MEVNRRTVFATITFFHYHKGQMSGAYTLAQSNATFMRVTSIFFFSFIWSVSPLNNRLNAI